MVNLNRNLPFFYPQKLLQNGPKEPFGILQKDGTIIKTKLQSQWQENQIVTEGRILCEIK